MLTARWVGNRQNLGTVLAMEEPFTVDDALPHGTDLLVVDSTCNRDDGRALVRGVVSGLQLHGIKMARDKSIVADNVVDMATQLKSVDFGIVLWFIHEDPPASGPESHGDHPWSLEYLDDDNVIIWSTVDLCLKDKIVVLWSCSSMKPSVVEALIGNRLRGRTFAERVANTNPTPDGVHHREPELPSPSDDITPPIDSQQALVLVAPGGTVNVSDATDFITSFARDLQKIRTPQPLRVDDVQGVFNKLNRPGIRFYSPGSPHK